ncbi:sensor histidine kinase [Tsukamurella asaccharolytica]|uniref:sensor histidine kinase n=1 Tax=Tsukamurella asaccharolytica TaxID=2592067 RepID=UPI0013159220|nr:histidine kinase [Tsukamurella asaccharolytica]
MFDGDRMRFGFAASVIGLALAAFTLRWGEDLPLAPILFAVQCLVVASRTLPVARLPERGWIAVEAVGAIAGGVLFALQPNPGTGLVLYISAVYYGVRVPQQVSIPLSALLGGTVALGLGLQRSGDFWIGLTIAITVWAGIARRTRQERTRALEQVVEQTKLTADSEARSSALAERARIARDLHDVLAHTLSGAGMQLELADALLEADKPDDARAAVQRARRAIADGVTEARGAVHALREDTVDLPTALAALADGPDEAVEAEPVELSDAQARAVLRVAQEAITNARRYAAGAPVTARVSPVPDGAELTVVNGRGTATGVAGSGMGLIGMRERAAEAGGTLHAGPTADGGWTVRLHIPTKEPA